MGEKEEKGEDIFEHERQFVFFVTDEYCCSWNKNYQKDFMVFDNYTVGKLVYFGEKICRLKFLC